MSDTQLQRILDAIEHDRQGILRTMQAVDGMGEDKRLEMVAEWLRRAWTHYRLQNAELYRLHVRKACAMLICGLLRVGEQSERGNEDAVERAGHTVDLLPDSEDRNGRAEEVSDIGNAVPGDDV